MTTRAVAGRRGRVLGPISAVVELWQYRNLISNLAQRELRSRYKKSVLGWLWSLLHPASVLLVYSLVFGVFLRVIPPPMANGMEVFALYLFCGLIMWNFLSATINGSMTALQSSGGLLSKVYFPAACPAIANQITGLLQIAIEFTILVAVMAWVGNLSWYALLFPVVVVFLALFALGIGLAVSVFNVFFRDIGYLVAIVMNFWFYSTPIVYPLSFVRDSLGERYVRLWQFNPMTQFVEMSRDLLYLQRLPDAQQWTYVVVVSVVTLVGGWLIFQRKSRDLTEEL